jgi:uncharacterized glyoxalase superfamily protein PhnB
MKVDAMIPLLNVEDPNRSIAFYMEALSFQRVRDATAGGRTVWAMLQNGAAKLMINRPDGADSAARRRRTGYRDTVLYLYVASARDVHAELTRRGIAAGDVETQPYGMEEFTLRDPDGYEIAIGSPLTRIA